MIMNGTFFKIIFLKILKNSEDIYTSSSSQFYVATQQKVKYSWKGEYFLEALYYTIAKKKFLFLVDAAELYIKLTTQGKLVSSIHKEQCVGGYPFL